jgi:cytochrome c oxidase cbb3-type subunit 3/ubiquinol-cytochrome c reductase cytochrome c subunit
MTSSSLAGRTLGLSLLLAYALLAGCDSAPGHAKVASEAPNPNLDFATVYRQNCSGCHGANGEQGPAIDLSNPVYQAIVDDATLRRIIINGQPGTLMPAFGRTAGGLLSDAQIDTLVHGMRDEWQKPGALSGQNPPAYSSTLTGDAARGQQAYTAYCSGCHGTGVKRGPKASAVLDPTFLALLSDPALRTIMLAGRPDLGMPDWRHQLTNQPDVAQPGHPMTDQDVADVVTWMATRRTLTPGQPYPQHP